MNCNRIEKYINTFEPINEGSRNHALHNAGLLLRKNFGLTGDALESWLSDVNRTKCTPPLSDAEVQTIARSVDGADIPAGEASTTHNKQHVVKKTKPFKTEHVAYHCTCTDAVPVAPLLQKRICFYQNCFANTPSGSSAIGEVLEAFKMAKKTRALIDNIRSEPDKKKRDALKQRLPAFVFGSEPQEQRNNDACEKAGRNGVICLDFDHIPADALESAKKTIVKVPYIFAVGLSAGGKGIFALAHYEGTPNLKKLLVAMQADFPYEIDKSRSDLCGYRYMTFDPDIIIKDSVAPAVLTEQTEPAENELVIVSEPPKRWQPFPLDTLPRQLRRFVTEVSRSIGIDSANTAASVLSIVSGVIGRMFRLKIKTGYQEHAMLWVALIADSGLGKSPALDTARKPIDHLQIEAWERYKAAKEQYDSDLEEYSRQQRKRKKEDYIVPVKPTEPVMSCYSVSDATTEALLPILSENPYGVCLVRDELAAFFNGMDAYRSGSVDRQVYIEIHGGRFVQAHRKTGVRYLAAKTPSLSIIGGIQSDVIRRTIHAEPEFLTTGFGARFLMVYPPAEPIRWNHNVADSTAIESYEGLIERLLQYRETYQPAEPGIVPLTPEATKLIFSFQNRHADESLDIADGNVRSVENKAGMHCARLALVLHVVGSLENGIDPVSPVPPETMGQAIALTEWFLNEAHRIYAMFNGGEEPADREAEAILSKIRELGGEATVRDLQHGIRRYRPKGGAETLERKLREMVADGILKTRRETAANGRDMEVFCIVGNTVTPVTVTLYPKTPVKNGIALPLPLLPLPENDFSPPDVIEGFEDYRNPESAVLESEHQPIPRCPECRFHIPENYPGGLCASGYCQQNLTCHDYEVAKTENTAS